MLVEVIYLSSINPWLEVVNYLLFTVYEKIMVVF